MRSFKKIIHILFCGIIVFTFACCRNTDTGEIPFVSTGNEDGNEAVPKTYTITYDTQLTHGVSITAKEQQVVFGETFVLYVPTHVDYEFLGWYTNDGVVFQNGIYTFNEDVTLTARWKEKENGGFGFS